MKKIINGKKYDTETAKVVGTFHNGYYGNDFRAMEESLYHKKTGEFFLCGEGGPMTKYSEAHGDMTSGGSKIIPLTLDEAKDWVEKNLSVEKYEELFGEVAE